MYKKHLKRILDIILALSALIMLSPLLILISMLLFINNGGKVFFVQKRSGLHGKLFTLIKFKTMNDYKDDQGVLLSDTKRLTFIGNVLRKTSMDEVPQLFNVLIGNISLIGPRPLLPEYLPHYNQQQQRRHEVLPGITGWAQINGRNRLSWEKKFEYDIYYVDHLSFSLDLKIFMMTLLMVLKMEHINASSSVTMEKFTGTNPKN